MMNNPFALLTEPGEFDQQHKPGTMRAGEK